MGYKDGFHSMALRFDFLDWRIWSPTIVDDGPDVSVIPAMLRRRLSPLGRAALSVMLPLAEHYDAMPVVYFSRHGELTRTLEMLKSLSAGEMLSPTAFSLSVHNSIAGLYSIHQKLIANVTAIAADEPLVPVLLEAFGQLDESTPHVLCVFCDYPVPEFYANYVDGPISPYAFACVITGSGQWQLAISTESPPVLAENRLKPDQAIQLMQMLEAGQGPLNIVSNGTQWCLDRCAINVEKA
jgi:hypothetical protein